MPPESVIDFNLHQFGLPLYVGYVPVKLPVKIPQRALSARLQVHFISALSGRVSGDLKVDQLEVRDSEAASLFLSLLTSLPSFSLSAIELRPGLR
jgi:Domain of Unknown Function (DUF748)